MPANRIFTRDDWTGDAEIACDAVVIGSGAGGAVVAAELAEGGLDVVVLEEGSHHRTEDFSTEVAEMVRKLYRDGGAQVAIGSPPVQFSEGRAVGGSTVINGGMSWRTPERILERWHREDGVLAVLPGEMDRYFARVEKFISSSRQDPWTIGRDNKLLKEGADKKGWAVVDNIRNQFHCAGTNNCAFGCPTGAKRSTLVTYIPRALAFGARVYSDCRVERLRRRGKRILGVEGHVVRENARRGARFAVHAGIVVVAAGAMHTPALLTRSGIRSPSGAIGKNLSLHPNAKIAAIFDETVEGWKGVHQAYQVREFQQEGFLFAAVNVPPSVTAMSMPAYGPELEEIMKDYHRMVTAGMLVEDTVTGRVRVTPGGRPVAFYSLADVDAERLVRGTALLCELLFAAGARRIVLPFEGVPDLCGPDEVRRIYQRKIPKEAMELMTVHLMGTARMGGDPARHVCDSYGKVYDTEGLYVADASLFPSPIGVNPMETIMALATRNAERILENTATRRLVA
jgi:choline dehydrogenase-like flavoprotein